MRWGVSLSDWTSLRDIHCSCLHFDGDSGYSMHFMSDEIASETWKWACQHTNIGPVSPPKRYSSFREWFPNVFRCFFFGQGLLEGEAGERCLKAKTGMVYMSCFNTATIQHTQPHHRQGADRIVNVEHVWYCYVIFAVRIGSRPIES